MILKFIITIVVVAVVWMIAKRVQRVGQVDTNRKTGTTSVRSLHKCGACGIYLPEGKTCDCANRT
jgi:steroid 5-alpha reductase family enzyme